MAPKLDFSLNKAATDVDSDNDGEMTPTTKATREMLEKVALDSMEAAEKAKVAAEKLSGAEAAEVKKLTVLAWRHAERCYLVTKAPKKRQSATEFLTMLGEEIQEQVEQTSAEAKAYAERNVRKAKSMVEDHFNIDEAFRLLGPLHQDPNFPRDAHDWFNLLALAPVVYLNWANWSFDFSKCPKDFMGAVNFIPTFWTDEAFFLFWWTTFGYFVTDLCWVWLVPSCVRSSGVIIKHHLLTIGYIMIPFTVPETRWIMGACMSVEFNTWFLIARRAFNRSGTKPWTPGVSSFTSFRLSFVSFWFYVSWFVIRIFFYPILFIVVIQAWLDQASRVGSYLNIVLVCPFMQILLIGLNFKWTIDLLRSKMKGRGAKGPSKGL